MTIYKVILFDYVPLKQPLKQSNVIIYSVYNPENNTIMCWTENEKNAQLIANLLNTKLADEIQEGNNDTIK